MIRVPRLTNVISYVIAALLFMTVIATVAYVMFTQPEHSVGALAGGLGLCVVYVLLMWNATSLDPVRGRIHTTRFGVVRRSLDLTQVTRLAVGGNHAGAVLLGLKASGPRVFVPVLHVTDVVKRSLDPGTLTSIADAVEQFVPHGASGKAQALAHLRAQATFTGAPQDSPLASLTSDALLRAGGAAGAGATIFGMLD